MKISSFVFSSLIFLFLTTENILFAQDDNATDITLLNETDPYNFKATFNYKGSSYNYEVSEKGNDGYSLVIWRKNTLLEGEAKMMEVYSTNITIDDETSNTNNKNARVRIQYAEKQGYVWKPQPHDFMQVMFLFDTEKINYAPFGQKMIDRNKHSSIAKENLVVQFDKEKLTLAEAVKISIEFFIMKYPKLFYM